MRRRLLWAEAAPIAQMDYDAGDPGWSPNFDCDDYAYAFKRWCDVRGFPCWQVWIAWLGATPREPAWHAMNIVAVQARHRGASATDVTAAAGASTFDNRWFALFEPQTNQVKAVWRQMAPVWGGSETPRIPSRVIQSYVATRSAVAGTGAVIRIWGSAVHLSAIHREEPPFTASAAHVWEFSRRTGLDPATARPLGDSKGH